MASKFAFKKLKKTKYPSLEINGVMTKKKKSFWERYAHKRLTTALAQYGDDKLFKLSNEERAALKKIRSSTYFKAGMAGLLGIALLYLPYHLFGETLFPKRSMWIPFLNQNIEVEIEFLVYSLVLVFLEIWYLTLVNIHAVDAISRACGAPQMEQKEFERHVDDLVNIGLERKQKELNKLGINPFAGLSKWSLFLYQTLVRLKATLTGFLWKILVARVLGRYAFRMLVDLLGGPIYAIWNMLGARKVMNEALVRVMAPPLIANLVHELKEQFGDRDEFKQIIFPTLQTIATSKRAYHYNHFLLAQSLVETFDLSTCPEYDPHFIQRIPELPADLRMTVAKVIIFGIIIDGKLSLLEKRTLRKMKTQGVISCSVDQVKKWSKDYFEGRGLDDFIVHK